MRARTTLGLLFVGFLLGFGAAALFGYLVDVPDDPRELVRRWGLFDNEFGELFVPLDGGEMLVHVVVDPDTRALKSIDVGKVLVGKMFEYRHGGDYQDGVPAAEYTGGTLNQVIWIDRNTDGWWDVRLTPRESTPLEVFVSGQWRPAANMRDGIAQTALGRLSFDPENGEWLPVEQEGPRSGSNTTE
jgi:hypothetical protein